MKESYWFAGEHQSDTALVYESSAFLCEGWINTNKPNSDVRESLTEAPIRVMRESSTAVVESHILFLQVCEEHAVCKTARQHFLKHDLKLNFILVFYILLAVGCNIGQLIKQ